MLVLIKKVYSQYYFFSNRLVSLESNYCKNDEIVNFAITTIKSITENIEKNETLIKKLENSIKKTDKPKPIPKPERSFFSKPASLRPFSTFGRYSYHQYEQPQYVQPQSAYELRTIKLPTTTTEAEIH